MNCQRYLQTHRQSPTSQRKIFILNNFPAPPKKNKKRRANLAYNNTET